MNILMMLLHCSALHLNCDFRSRYQGHIGSSLIVGGVDVTGAHLYSVYPHGSYDKLPFLTMGIDLHLFI